MSEHPPSSVIERRDRFEHLEHEVDICVVGGGMAGLCAAIAAARNGARTMLLHDRPVLGGNASSEIRMWICGAHGKHNKETGVLEEIQLANLHRNPSLNYPIWDSVLYEKAFFQPNLTPLLNTSVLDATMEGGRIAAVHAWTLTSQTRHTVRARYFIDSSGDSILAVPSGAEVRRGRESREEFDEDIEPLHADRRTMGNSLLIQLRKTDSPQPFIPPRWAYRFEKPEDLPHRINGVQGANFWWIEVGGCDDTIHDAERIRDELMRITYGVWDYIKNRAPERDQAENWAVEWIGALPGKRENRRYVGDHLMTQHDVRAADQFADVVAYGGWTMDDHHPAGLLYPGKPTIFHRAPSPFQIPYRSLYSRNVANLFCAGRNISVTHAALSATRVMATCAVIGQAAGTAAALCSRHRCDPRSLSSGERLAELQRTLMDDDAWLPGVRRPHGDLARQATLAGGGRDAGSLLDGLDRDREGESHAWVGQPGEPIEFLFDQPTDIAGARIVFDSDLCHTKRMPCSYPQRGDRCLVPGSLVRGFRLDARRPDGAWHTVHRLDENHRRLVRLPLGVRATGLRLVPESTWGDDDVRVFAFEPLAAFTAKDRDPPLGPTIAEVRARRAEANPRDMAPPDSGLEAEAGKVKGSA